jgi:hypothetical protein
MNLEDAGARTFSDAWHRVSGVRAQLRSSVIAHRQHFRGQPWVILRDRFNSEWFRLTPDAYAFLCRLGQGCTVDQAWNDGLAVDPDRALTQEEVVQLLGQLNLSNLLNDFERPHLTLEYALRVDNIGKVIPLAPKELAVYALFSEFPDGLPLSHVPDHLDRLTAWYRRFYTGSGEDPQQIVQVARRLAFNEDDDLSQNVSRLNRRIKNALDQLGDPLPYTIQGPNGGPKGIPAVAEGLVRVVSRPV